MIGTGEIVLQCADGQRLAATLFQVQGESRGVVVFAGALGVPRKIYRAMAGFLVRHKFTVLSFDYRGCGDNSLHTEVRLHEWGTQDLEAAFAYAIALQAGPVFSIGHSIGAQLTAFASSAPLLGGAISVAGSFPYIGRFPLRARLPLILNFYCLIPLYTALRPSFPAARAGLGSFDLPSSIMRDWMRWIKRPDYLLDKRFGFNPRPFAQLQIPLLAFGFSDDPLVPFSAFEKLLEVYRSCSVEPRYIDPGVEGLASIGHTGFFRERLRETLWRETLDWLNARSATQAVAEPG